MVSVLWGGVFIFLCIEVFLTVVLCIPLPQSVQRAMSKFVFEMNIVKKVTIVFQFIAVGLIVAISDAVMTIKRLRDKVEAEGGKREAETGVGYVYDSLDKQRLFRAERNLYLAAFALTLLFVIRRILELMRDTIKAKDEASNIKAAATSANDKSKKAVDSIKEAASQATASASAAVGDKKNN